MYVVNLVIHIIIINKIFFNWNLIVHTIESLYLCHFGQTDGNTHTHTHTPTHTPTHPHTHTHKHTRTHRHTCTCAYTHKHTTQIQLPIINSFWISIPTTWPWANSTEIMHYDVTICTASCLANNTKTNDHVSWLWLHFP